jgi:hypothetical protein
MLWFSTEAERRERIEQRSIENRKEKKRERKEQAEPEGKRRQRKVAKLGSRQ